MRRTIFGMSCEEKLHFLKFKNDYNSLHTGHSILRIISASGRSTIAVVSHRTSNTYPTNFPATKNNGHSLEAMRKLVGGNIIVQKI